VQVDLDALVDHGHYELSSEGDTAPTQLDDVCWCWVSSAKRWW
jgi:hypothetical protein